MQEAFYKKLTSEGRSTKDKQPKQPDRAHPPRHLNPRTTIVYQMFPRTPNVFGGGDSWEEHPMRPYPPRQQKSATKERRRPERASSADQYPTIHVDREQDSNILQICSYFGAGDQLAELERKNQELELKEKDLRARLEEKEHQLHERETEVQELKKTLEIHGEMKETLCMYDDCSEVDMRKMVDSVNTRIQDVACSTAILWLRNLPKDSDSVGDGEEASEAEVNDLKELIGPHVVDLLSEGGEIAATLLPLAWQASIIATVAKILSSFSASLVISRESQAGDELLRKIANEVMMGGKQCRSDLSQNLGEARSLSSSFIEVQPAYGRWRLITHQYLRRVMSSHERSAVRTCVREALAHCGVVGRLVMKSHCPDEQAFKDAFQPQLHAIMDEAFGLSTIIQERRVTANYEPYMPPSGTPFQPESMVVETRDKAFPDDHVVCTTGLGLLYWKKEGRVRTSEPSPKHVFTEAQVFTERNLYS